MTRGIEPAFPEGVTIDEVALDGMRVLTAAPSDAPPDRAVLMLPHVGGLTETMKIMAATVAAAGYLCAVPDLYHRLGRIVLDPESNDADATHIRQIAAASVTEETAMADAGATLEFLAGQPSMGKSMGTIGFGRSGYFALLAAATFPDRVGAAASILGFGFSALDERTGPSLFARVRGEAYFAFAERDDIIPADEPEAVRRLIAQCGLTANLAVHPGARHPYLFPDRLVHDPHAAAIDWETVFAMFERNLGR